MDKLYKEEDVRSLANAIQEKTGKADAMKLSEMVGEIDSIDVLQSAKGLYDGVTTEMVLPYEKIPKFLCYGNSWVKIYDMPYATYIGEMAFYHALAATHYVLRASQVVTLGDPYCLIGGYRFHFDQTKIYVPRETIELYKSDEGYWKMIFDAFDYSFLRAIEDYTVDGTIMGELDREKMNA